MHLAPLITDLALILVVAGFVALVFRWLNQPLVLGYLVAGLLVGPQTKFLPTVTETEHLKTWAELGVILLLFLLGLEFSFKKLFRVGPTALMTASVEVIGMVAIGFGLGKLIGWNTVDSIFLGGILSISSTTIIVKAFEELGVRSQFFASTVIGILVIEDLYAILILALLSTFAVTRTFEGSALLIQVGKVVGFLAISLPVGLWFIPRSLRVFHRFLNDETRVVISVGGCLTCVYLASTVGLSPALGAFLMGAFIAETSEGERIERILKPVRDLFGAVFFTSIGLLVDIEQLIQNIGLVLLISVVTIVGKLATTVLGMKLAKADSKLALQSGLSLAQIGEFSFIIATLGLSMGVVRLDLYPITVAVSVITTFTTPYLIRYAVYRGAKGRKRSKDSRQHQLWDGHVVELEIHPQYKKIGQTLEQLKLREKFGVTLVAINRGEQKIVSPTRYDSLMPFDSIQVFGSDSQLHKFTKHLRLDRVALDEAEEATFGMEKATVAEKSSLVGKSILDSKIRDRIDGVILGIERKGERVLNPESHVVLEKFDELWLYGNLDKIKTFRNT